MQRVAHSAAIHSRPHGNCILKKLNFGLVTNKIFTASSCEKATIRRIVYLRICIACDELEQKRKERKNT